MSTSQLDLLFDAVDGSTPGGVRDGTMLELLIASGARISELARLCLNDFDRSHQTLRLLGKGSKERIVPLYNKAFDSLDIYVRQARLALLEKAHCSQSDTTRLFISDRGRPMDAAALRLACKKSETSRRHYTAHHAPHLCDGAIRGGSGSTKCPGALGP